MAGRARALAVTLGLAMAGIVPGGAPAAAVQDIGLPVFGGPANPVPPEPAPYTVGNMMRAMYERDLRTGDGTDFWMDRLLARPGRDPAGNWLMTRGRAVFMKTHTPSVIGFGGQVAYVESIDNRSAYTITIGTGGLTENADARLQTPSYWRGQYIGGDLRADVTKFITDGNVAVTNLSVTNTGAASVTVPLTVSSPYATTPDGAELTGVVDSFNRLTTLFPRLSGDGFAVSGTSLTRSVTLAPGQTVTTKVQLGFVAREIPQSLPEYRAYRALGPAQAFARQVRTYNRWWADNVPYIDLPDPNIKKYVYYRWWISRFNYLDANIPGNTYQFPTSVEGALGYNNAIVLTVPFFIQDLKYLRDPMYSYGPWVSAGEVSRNTKYTDNPGDPANWSNSYAQFITESALQSWQIHGGDPRILANLAHYGEADVRGQLANYDSNHNLLIQYDNNALTGNDADAVSFDFFRRGNERTETAFLYGNAIAAATAYELSGNPAKAAELRELAEHIRQAILSVLWNPVDKVFAQHDVPTNSLIPWKEINNYYPFTEGLVPDNPEYREALRFFTDPAQFPIFPFYTANQADKAAATAAGRPGSNNFSQINSTNDFRMLDTVLRRYPSSYVDNSTFKQLLYWNAWAGFVNNDNRYPDTNEFWFNWNPTAKTFGRSGIHHTQLGANNWTIVEDVAGLRPRTDDKLELWPIDIGWDHFTVNNLNYRGSDLTIVWDDPRDGRTAYPGVPQGFSAYVNGRRVSTVDSLAHLVYDPRTGRVEFPDGGGSVLFHARAPGMRAPADVRLAGRTADLLNKAGVDLDQDGPNLATAATASASFTAAGTDPAAATDGFTINQPIWGSAGSGHAQDSYELDLGRPTRLDDVRLFFYTDPTEGNRYREPAVYTVQYQDRRGGWVTVRDQHKSPAVPAANRNEVAFRAVTTRRVRVLMTHQAGFGTGLKEVQVLRTGDRHRPDANQAPSVLARSDPAFTRPAQARLVGVVKDDGLPAGTLASTWRMVSGPGVAIFDNPASPRAVATFTAPGTYVLELTATDGRRSASSRVTVVSPPPSPLVNMSLYATPTVSSSSPWESVAAINDGIDPPRSNDTVNPRWGTWPNTGTQWAELDWADPVRVNAADVFFFDDGGGVRVPASWTVQYWDGNAFVDVANPSGYATAADRYNRVTFDPVTTTRMRVSLVSGAASVGLLEWKNYAVAPTAIRDVHLPTLAGRVPALPARATAVYDDGARLEPKVVWRPIGADQVAQPETSVSIVGVVEGTTQVAHATVYVRRTDQVTITNLAEETVTTRAGIAPVLPATVLATYNDGSRDNVTTTVTWDPVDPAQYAKPGSFVVTGRVAGTTLPARATVTVQP